MMYYDRLHTKRKSLREVLTEKAVFAPCVYNCFTAQIVEHLGFDAMCFSGAYFASSYVGVPDIGLPTTADRSWARCWAAARPTAMCAERGAEQGIGTGGVDLHVLDAVRGFDVEMHGSAVGFADPVALHDDVSL